MAGGPHRGQGVRLLPLRRTPLHLGRHLRGGLAGAEGQGEAGGQALDSESESRERKQVVCSRDNEPHDGFHDC